MHNELDIEVKRRRVKIIRELDPNWHKCSNCSRMLGRKKIITVTRLNGEIIKLCRGCTYNARHGKCNIKGLAYMSVNKWKEIDMGW